MPPEDTLKHRNKKISMFFWVDKKNLEAAFASPL